MHTLKIFFKLCDMNLKKLFVFRSSFFIALALSAIWATAYSSLIEVVFHHTDSLAGFNKGEVFTIMAFYYLIMNMSDVFFKSNIEDFGETVRRGELDFRLVKPAPSRLLSFFWEIRFDHAAGLIPTTALFFYGISQLPEPIAPAMLLLGFAAVLVSLIIYFSILSMVATLIFWIQRSENLGPLIFHMSQISRYPRHMYRGIFQKMVTYGLPLALLASIPAEISFQRFEFEITVYFAFAAIVFFFLSRFFWKFGLERYTSAN